MEGAVIPAGMGVVVPAERILEVLDLPELKQMREKFERLQPERSAATLDSALPTKAENPRHREDFNRLLDAAGKGKRSTDRT